MKTLVATRQTQGRRATDAAECIDGELVFLLEPCEWSRRSPYGPCDCGRTFRGVFSDAVTTTAVVRDLEGFSVEDFVLALKSHHSQTKGCTCNFDVADRMAAEMLVMVQDLPEGAVIERRLDWLTVRKPQSQKRRS
jgi:hypothetical protein